MIERKGKNGRSVKRASMSGKKKSAGNWFSLDSLMGKSLCILLVVILTVGAFLAPKLINNLYDAGTLMQITYMDMDLSTYAVAYTSFQEKIMAIARAKTAGDKLVALPAEEADEKVGDEELIQLVNQEMESRVRDTLFSEDWWWQLTGENLISREKVTAYAQTQMNAQDTAAGREMAPIQFWILSFQITDEQMIYRRYEYEEMVKTQKIQNVDSSLSRYATDRLIVCLDAEFYKIYAIAMAGDGQRITDMYGWDLAELFAANGNKYWSDIEVENNIDLRMFLTDQNLEDWSRYWDVTPEDKAIYLYLPGELSGCIAFQDGQTGADDTETDHTETGSNSASVDGVVEAGTMAEEIYNWEYDAFILNSVDDETYRNMNMESKNEMLLEVGISGGYDAADAAVWIQKSGCREFFEMMQF